MAVLHPLKVVIVNYPEDQTEELEAVNNPEDSEAGTRRVPFSRELYIEREDFQRIRQRSSSAWPRAARCGCAGDISSNAST